MRNEKKYQPAQDFSDIAQKSEGGSLWFAKGPGDGFGDNHGYLWSWTRVSTKTEAEQLCRFMNRAYAEGHKAAKDEIRMALGVKL